MFSFQPVTVKSDQSSRLTDAVFKTPTVPKRGRPVKSKAVAVASKSKAEPQSGKSDPIEADDLGKTLALSVSLSSYYLVK